MFFRLYRWWIEYRIALAYKHLRYLYRMRTNLYLSDCYFHQRITDLNKLLETAYETYTQGKKHRALSRTTGNERGSDSPETYLSGPTGHHGSAHHHAAQSDLFR